MPLRPGTILGRYEVLGPLGSGGDHGLDSYPMLVRDRLLDPIRSGPEFQRFLAETKARWERYRSEFEGND